MKKLLLLSLLFLINESFSTTYKNETDKAAIFYVQRHYNLSNGTSLIDPRDMRILQPDEEIDYPDNMIRFIQILDFETFCLLYSLSQDNVKIKPNSKEKLTEFLTEARKKYIKTNEKVLIIPD